MDRQQATPLGSRLSKGQRNLLAPTDRAELVPQMRRGGVIGRAVDFLLGPPTPQVNLYVNEQRQQELEPSDFQVQKEQYTPMPFSGWNGAMIQHAMDQADQGIFNEMEFLFQAMKKEPRIGSGLARRASQLLRLKRTMEIDNDAPPELIAMAKSLEKDFRYVLSDGELRQFAERFIFFGFSLGPIDWTYRSNQQMPRAKCWTHSYIQWHWPRRQFFAQRDSSQTGQSGEVWIPPEGDGKNWMVMTLGGERPWLDGAGRKLGNTWFNIIQTWDRWLELNDEFAEPLKALKTPPLRRESPEVQKMWAVVNMLRGGDTVLLPEGYGMEYLQAVAQGYETFKSALLDVWYANVAIVLFGHNLAQYARGGSGAKTGVSSGTEISHELTEGDATVAQDAWAPVGRVWVRAQTGYEDDEAYQEAGFDQPLETYAPQLVIDTKPPEDQKQKAETQQASAKAMATFADAVGPEVMAKLPIDYKASAEASGWQMLEGGKATEVTPEDVTAGGKKPQAEGKTGKVLPAQTETETLDGRRVAARGKSQRLKDMTGIASVAVFSPAGQLLMGKRRDSGKWTMPGGHLEPGEGAAAGAARELLEEAGIAAPLEYIGSGTPGRDILVHCFRCVTGATPNSAADPDEEVDRWDWLDLPLAADVVANLHAPRNVTLALLGRPSGEVVIYERARVAALLAA